MGLDFVSLKLDLEKELRKKWIYDLKFNPAIYKKHILAEEIKTI